MIPTGRIGMLWRARLKRIDHQIRNDIAGGLFPALDQTRAAGRGGFEVHAAALRLRAHQRDHARDHP